MSQIRDLLVQRLWAGRDPLENAAKYSDRLDLQGWGFDHPYLTDTIEEIQPRLVVEVGVWKGLSTLVMADRLHTLGLPSAVLAVDTWLGSWDLWMQPTCFEDLRIDDGYPTLYRTFLANVAAAGLSDYIVPLPLDSQNAAQLLERCGIGPVDMVHIDAGHDYAGTLTCIAAWWPLVGTGGVMIGDDYAPGSAYWPEVVRAFDDYFGRERIESKGAKCLIRKR